MKDEDFYLAFSCSPGIGPKRFHDLLRQFGTAKDSWEKLSKFDRSNNNDLRFTIKDLRVIAIEQNDKSVPYDKADYSFPIALVVGHETTGVSKEVLEISDQIVELPMWGVNKSLNVMVSLGIVLYEVMKKR
jgi:tRNA (guanosine-2'-O-)-methyltransferase